MIGLGSDNKSSTFLGISLPAKKLVLRRLSLPDYLHLEEAKGLWPLWIQPWKRFQQGRPWKRICHTRHRLSVHTVARDQVENDVRFFVTFNVARARPIWSAAKSSWWCRSSKLLTCSKQHLLRALRNQHSRPPCPRLLVPVPSKPNSKSDPIPPVRRRAACTCHQRPPLAGLQPADVPKAAGPDWADRLLLSCWTNIWVAGRIHRLLCLHSGCSFPLPGAQVHLCQQPTWKSRYWERRRGGRTSEWRCRHLPPISSLSLLLCL